MTFFMFSVSFLCSVRIWQDTQLDFSVLWIFFLLIISMLKHIMRENGRKLQRNYALILFPSWVFFSQFISWTLYIPTIKQNIFYIFIIHLLKICQNILFLQIYFYPNGIWCWSHAFREKISLQLVLGSMSLAWKKEIVNLLLDFGSSIMCWFTHLSHLFVAFLSPLLTYTS